MYLFNDYSQEAQKEFNLSNSIFELSLLNLQKVKEHFIKYY